MKFDYDNKTKTKEGILVLDSSTIIQSGFLVISGFLMLGWPLYILTLYRYANMLREKSISNAANGLGLGAMAFQIGLGSNILFAIVIGAIFYLLARFVFKATVPTK